MPYVPGDWWMICDVCGCKRLHSAMRKRWDGAWVCPDDWEPRHPQEVGGPPRPDNTSVPVARPRPEPVYDTKLTRDHI